MNMNRHISYIIISLFMLLATAGCTHNNGDIGSLFGRWKLSGVSAQNADVPQIDGAMYWSFQNTTIEMLTLGDHQQEARVYGNWRSSGQTLFLDFSDADMQPPSELLLPAQTELEIVGGIGNTLTLQYHPSPSQSIIYEFIKY